MTDRRLSRGPTPSRPTVPSAATPSRLCLASLYTAPNLSPPASCACIRYVKTVFFPARPGSVVEEEPGRAAPAVIRHVVGRIDIVAGARGR